MEAPFIEVRNLKKYYKTNAGMLHAVDDVSFPIYAGTTLGVVGESGCGKSTLGMTMLRLIEATSGEILYNGQDLLKIKPSAYKTIRKDMQMVFQDPYSSLNPRMNVETLIAEPMIVNGVFHSRAEVSKRVKELMDTVGLAQDYADSYPHELDGGRRQRIGVARALSLEPKFIVCDEPVSALDVSIQAQILNLLMDLQDNMGLTYMFITHDLSVVKHISTNIMVMYLGVCVEMAPSNELFFHAVHPYTKALLSAIPIPDLSSRHKERDVISGEITSPVEPAPGCRFAQRCPACTAQCTGSDIPLREIGTGHFVRCVHI